MKHFKYLLTGLLLLVISCSENETPEEHSEDNTTKTATTDDALPGRKIFVSKCMSCHGIEGAGIGNAANLRISTLDTSALKKMIENGKNAMPAFKGQLNTNTLTQLTDYVYSLRQ